jgi:hypothetical protein
VVDAATEDFLPPEPPEPPELPEPELDPESDPLDELEEEPEELEDSADFPLSDFAEELSAEEPFDPASLPAATVLAPFRLSVR